MGGNDGNDGNGEMKVKVVVVVVEEIFDWLPKNKQETRNFFD